MAQRALDQEQRLAEVQSLTQDRLEILRAFMQNPVGQRKVVQHFDAHREEFQGIEIDGLEIDSAAAYQQLFRRHVQRTDLWIFTYISSKGRRPRMWSFVAMDNGVVSLYNETQNRHWSLFRPPSFAGYLQSGRGWWVEVIFGTDSVRVEKW